VDEMMDEMVRPGNWFSMPRVGWPSEFPVHEFPVHYTAMGVHQGTMIPWSKCYNYKISMEVVGPPGLEPGTKGLWVLLSLSRSKWRRPGDFQSYGHPRRRAMDS